jgi:hypothetical protein
MNNRINRIYKYNLQIYNSPDSFKLCVRGYNPIPLSVADQDGRLTLWVRVELKESKNDDYETDLQIHVVATEQGIYDSETLKYIGTAIMNNGHVWHVFYEPTTEQGGAERCTVK